MSAQKKMLFKMVIDNYAEIMPTVHFPIAHCPYSSQLMAWMINQKIVGKKIFEIQRELDNGRVDEYKGPMGLLLWLGIKSGLNKDGKIVIGRDIIFPDGNNSLKV